MSPDMFGEPLHRWRQATDEEHHFIGIGAVQLPLPVDHPYGPQVSPVSCVAERLGGWHDEVLSPLDAAMPGLGLREPPQSGHVVVLVASVLEALLNLLVQHGLVALDRQYVVGTPVTDRLGRLLLAMHGIQRHDCSRQLEEIQELRHRRDLVRAFVDCHLTKADLQITGPRVEQVQGVFAGSRIERMPQRLAIEPNAVIRNRRVERPNPSLQAGVELRRVESSEDPPERIVRGDAVGKLEKPGKPFPLLLAEPLDVSPSLRPADCCAQGDGHHVDQQVALRPRHPRVGQVLEV
jgi:hypothetical protein